MWTESQWKFGNLTSEQRQQVKELAQTDSYDQIKQIYSHAGVLPKCNFCSLVKDVKDWTVWAIHENII